MHAIIQLLQWPQRGLINRSILSDYTPGILTNLHFPSNETISLERNSFRQLENRFQLEFEQIHSECNLKCINCIAHTKLIPSRSTLNFFIIFL